MKKFYAFAAAAFMALAANAQNGAPLYATGAGPAFDPSWAPSEPYQFDYADGTYTLELDGLTQFKISTSKDATAEDGWAGFNAGLLGTVNNATPELGVATALTTDTDPALNIETPGKGDYIVTVAGDLSTITLTAKGEIDTSFPDVYVRGDMNSWGAPEEWMMEVVVPKTTFKLTVPEPITVGQAFKIADADWNKVNYGGKDEEPIIADTEVELDKGGKNLTLGEDFNGTIYFTLNYDNAVWVYFATSDEDLPEWAVADNSAVSTIAASSNVAAKYYNLQGVQVANPENGLFIVVKGDKVSKVLVK